MKLKLCVLMIAAVFSISCSSLKGGRQEVIIDDGYKTTGAGEVVFEDKDLKHVQEAIDTTKESTQEEFLAPDGSRIKIMTDSYGNKSEMRYFANDPKLEMILLRTSASGQKQVYVYGQNGDVKDLPPNMIDRALTSTAAELASAAGIYEGKKQQMITRTFTGTTSPIMPQQPLPTADIQAETQQSDNASQIETREETPAKKSESSGDNSTDQIKTPIRIGQNLQNFVIRNQKKKKAND